MLTHLQTLATLQRFPHASLGFSAVTFSRLSMPQPSLYKISSRGRFVGHINFWVALVPAAVSCLLISCLVMFASSNGFRHHWASFLNPLFPCLSSVIGVKFEAKSEFSEIWTNYRSDIWKILFLIRYLKDSVKSMQKYFSYHCITPDLCQDSPKINLKIHSTLHH